MATLKGRSFGVNLVTPGNRLIPQSYGLFNIP